MKISELGLLSLGALALAVAPLPASLPVLGTHAAVAKGGGHGGGHGGGGHGGSNGNSSHGQSDVTTHGKSGKFSDPADAPNSHGKFASALGGLNAYHALLNGNEPKASSNSTVGMIQTYVADYNTYMTDLAGNQANPPTVDQTTLDGDLTTLNTDLQALGDKVNRQSLYDTSLTADNITAPSTLSPTYFDFYTALNNGGLLDSPPPPPPSP